MLRETAALLFIRSYRLKADFLRHTLVPPFPRSLFESTDDEITEVPLRTGDQVVSRGLNGNRHRRLRSQRQQEPQDVLCESPADRDSCAIRLANAMRASNQRRACDKTGAT